MNIFTGSFDPPTRGHLSIITRAAKLLGSLTVVVCDNLSKKHMFTQSDRYAMMYDMVKDIPNVKMDVLPQGKMLSSHITSNQCKVLVRGVRNGLDLEYERSIEDFVKEYGIDEVIYLLNEPELANCSSSAARNHLMAMRETDAITSTIYKYLPPPVVKAMLDTEYAKAFTNIDYYRD